MELNQVEFEKGCERFRGRYPDFKSFEEPGDQYLQDERLYKLELIELYEQEVQPHLLGMLKSSVAVTSNFLTPN